MQSSDLAEYKRPNPLTRGLKRVLTVQGRADDISPYLDALRSVGIEGVLSASASDSSLDEADGLMLIGGTDVNPERYGEEKAPETEAPDNARDQHESALLAQALERALPILAICRGMQMLNVHHGGTLVQHLATVERHRKRPTDKSLDAHAIEIIPGTKLAKIAGTGFSREVNSRHHQAVGRLGAGLVVSATDPEDGVIEAIERPDRPFVIGVQWHPENQISTNVLARQLFEAFRAAL